MFRKTPGRMHTFFNSFIRQDYVDPISLLVIGVMGFSASVRNAMKGDQARVQILPQLFLSDMVFLIPAVAALTFVTSRAILRAVDISVHPNRKVALAFFQENPDYPVNKKEDAANILCPLLRDESDKAVCLSFIFKDKQYVHAYDYDALKSYYLTEGGVIDPASSIFLLSNNVTNLKLSFDVPENTPELIQPEVEEKTTDVVRRVGYGA